MQVIEEGALAFDFAVGSVRVLKYDDTVFYRNRLQKVCPHRRGVDILCLDGDKTLWLIEVKDYRSDTVEKDRSRLADVIVDKVLDTLAGLRCAQFADTTEKDFASAAAKAERLQVVAHIEGRGRMRDDSKHLRRSQTELAFAADLKVRLHQKLIKLGMTSAVAGLKYPKQGCPWTVRSLSFSETID